MKKPITFPLYIDRWIGGTRHFPLEVRAIYLEWLLWCWAQNRPLPLDSLTRAQIAGASLGHVREAWPILRSHWSRVTNGYVNLSLERKRSEYRDFHDSQRVKARLGAAARWKNHTPKTDARGIARANAREMPGAMPSYLVKDQDHLRSKKLNKDQALSGSDPHLKKEHRAPREMHVNGKKPDENQRALLKLAIGIVRKPNTVGEWVAQLKDAAAVHGLAYSGQAAHRAVTRAEHVLKRERAGRR